MEKQNNINVDPLASDETKGKRGRKPKEPSAQEKYNSVHPMNPWVVGIIERSDTTLTAVIVNVHDMTVNNLLSATGQYITEHTDEYERLFRHNLTSNGFSLTDSLTVIRKPVEKPKPEPIPQVENKDEIVFHTRNPLDEMTFRLEERQYRRIRKKINFVDSKVLLDTILAIDESKDPSTFVNMYVRKSVSSDPDKDKLIRLTDLVHHVVVTLNSYSQPSTYENRSFLVDKFLVRLMDDITSGSDGSIYTKNKLIKFVAKVRDEVKEEVDKLYSKIYHKVGLEEPKPLTSKKKPSLTIRNEPDEVKTLYANRDLDLTNLIFKLDYYTMLNIID